MSSKNLVCKRSSLENHTSISRNQADSSHIPSPAACLSQPWHLLGENAATLTLLEVVRLSPMEERYRTHVWITPLTANMFRAKQGKWRHIFLPVQRLAQLGGRSSCSAEPTSMLLSSCRVKWWLRWSLGSRITFVFQLEGISSSWQWQWMLAAKWLNNQSCTASARLHIPCLPPPPEQTLVYLRHI